MLLLSKIDFMAWGKQLLTILFISILYISLLKINELEDD